MKEDLQQQAEFDHRQSDEDVQAYKKVFEALKREPSFSVHHSFADEVVALAQKKPETSRDGLWMGLGIALLVITAIVVIAITGFKFEVGIFKFLSSYYRFVIFAIAFIIALHWVDRRLLKQRFLPE